MTEAAVQEVAAVEPFDIGPFDPVAFRDKVRARPLVTYDELDTYPMHLAGQFENWVDEILDAGWTRHGLTISLAPPLEWTSSNRSFSNHLHAWEPLTFLLKAACVVQDAVKKERYFQASRIVVLDWLSRFQEPAYAHGPAWATSEAAVEAQGFAWYDMTVGQRIYRIAFVLDYECRHGNADAAFIAALYKSLVFHHEVLCFDGFFRAHTNHGIYQSLGQLAASKRFIHVVPEFKRYFDLAQKRFAHVLDQHYSADNVHKEHSPGYHYMLLGSLIGAQQTNLIDDPTLQQRLLDMEEAGGWMIKPDYGLVPFGDTDPRILGSKLEGEVDENRGIVKVARRYHSQTLQAVRTKGAIGVLPKAGVMPFYDGGFAFARLYAPGVEPVFENASFLAQMAAFHSRTHKHADHLSFIWHDRRRDILIDPARYAYAGRTEPGSDLFEQGFWYSDPKRIYVETTRAHNCVEIDGTSYRRRNTRRYGSALVYAGEQAGLAVMQTEVLHSRYVRHYRTLVMRPGHFLLVLDWLNDRTTPHRYRQFFQLGPEWQVEKAGPGYTANAPADGVRPATALTVIPLLDGPVAMPPVCGQEEPELLGWMSPDAYELVPTPNLHFDLPETNMARFATLFVLGDSATLDPKGTRMTAALRAGKLAWTDGLGKHLLRFGSNEAGLQVQWNCS